MKIQFKELALLCAAISCLFACNAPESESVSGPQKYDSSLYERPDMMISEVALPKGYERVAVPEGSFASFLRSLPLRPQGAKLRSCRGLIQEDQSAVSAVLFHSVPLNGSVKAADVPVFLYSEYVCMEGNADDLAFKLPGGFEARYQAWRDGARFKADGAMPVADTPVPADSSMAVFSQYLEKVLSFTTASSISDMFAGVEEADVQVGDVAVTADGGVFTVADIAVKRSAKSLLFVCGLDDASEIYIPASVGKKSVSPWHACKKGGYDIGECSFYRIVGQ